MVAVLCEARWYYFYFQLCFRPFDTHAYSKIFLQLRAWFDFFSGKAGWEKAAAESDRRDHTAPPPPWGSRVCQEFCFGDLLYLQLMASVAVDVTNRKSLFKALYDAAEGDAAKARSCLVVYSPPGERLILRCEEDFATLGTSAEALKDAADKDFWAFADFDGVLESFQREKSDPERRVMGIEGVGSKDQLQTLLATPTHPGLKIGHLSYNVMQGKVDNGEWEWINEAGCEMKTATPKPGLDRQRLASTLGLAVRVIKHDASLSSGQAEEAAVVESVGDLIIFDMDKGDVSKEAGNTKVFCQDPLNYSVLDDVAALPEAVRAAVDQVFELEFLAS